MVMLATGGAVQLITNDTYLVTHHTRRLNISWWRNRGGGLGVDDELVDGELIIVVVCCNLMIESELRLAPTAITTNSWNSIESSPMEMAWWTCWVQRRRVELIS